jgi:hypothetical protein
VVVLLERVPDPAQRLRRWQGAVEGQPADDPPGVARIWGELEDGRTLEDVLIGRHHTRRTAFRHAAGFLRVEGSLLR